MKILLACEESQTVTKAFREKGHEAYSCDTKPCSGGHFEWHIQDDAIKTAYNYYWDMMIAFPPCTHLAVSGARHFKKKEKDGRQKSGIDFFMKLVYAPIEKIAIENPIGIMSTKYRRPDQIIQPWQFGDPYHKSTCLWLKNLPFLFPTKIVSKGEFIITPSGKRMPKWYSDKPSTKSENNRKIRSTFWPGIAKAMAEQWNFQPLKI
jgi:hypothetical protein